MKLINLKLDKKKETKDRGGEVVSVDSNDDYPYGLRIRLTGEALEKLGIKLSGVAAGSLVNGTMIGIHNGGPE